MIIELELDQLIKDWTEKAVLMPLDKRSKINSTLVLLNRIKSHINDLNEVEIQSMRKISDQELEIVRLIQENFEANKVIQIQEKIIERLINNL